MVPDVLKLTQTARAEYGKFTHKGKSGRVYESDHPITDAERQQIDKFDTEVEQPKRRQTKPKVVPQVPVRQPRKGGFLQNALQDVQNEALQQEGLRTGNPNYDPSIDSYTDFGKIALPESRAKASPNPRKRTDKDPLASSLPMLVASQAAKKGPGIAATALANIGGANVEQQTREAINASPIAEFGKYLIPGIGGLATAESTARGAVTALDELGKGKPEAALMELATNVALPAALHGIATKGVPALVKAWQRFRAGGSSGQFVDEAIQAGMKAEDAQAAVKVVETPPVKGFGVIEDAKAAEPPKVDTPPAQTGQGISHAEVDTLRNEFNWSPRNPTEAKPDAQLAEDAKKLAGSESTIADRIVARTEKGEFQNPKETLSDEESVALGRRLTALKQQMEEAKAKGDGSAWDLADQEAQKIADALDETGSRQGRAFRARRFLFKGQDDSWTLNRRAVKANQGQPLDAAKQAELDKTIADLQAANKQLEAERDKAIKGLELFKSAVKSKSSRGKGPLSGAQKRQSALNSLKKLGIEVSEEFPDAPQSGGMASKQSGAINIPAGSTEQVAKAVRSLARSYVDEGAKNWDDVLKLLKRDLPGIDEDQALFILSGEYKVKKVAADVHAKKVNAFMRDLKADAEYRTKPFIAKVTQFVGDLGNTTARSLQTTLDNSLALIQNKNVLMSRPGTWLKGVGTSFNAMAKKDPIEFARRHLAEIENHPLYAKAAQAKLSLSDVDGPFSKQEEFLAGMLENKVPGISHSKAMATTLGNTIRFDLFRKMAANLPNDAPAEAYEDIARLINIMTGKGTGRAAELLGSKEAGMIAYAPRFYLSKWQHNLGVPIWAAKTAAGRKEAIKSYAAQMAMYGTAFGAFEAFGWDVDFDPRSATFGKAFDKDRTRSIDLFYQQSEGVRVMAQMIWGRTSASGNYSEPGDWGDYGPGDYLESKLSPIGRTAQMAVTGKTFDDVTGERRSVNKHDYWKAYIPLSIKEMRKNPVLPWAPISFMGGGVDVPRKQKANVKKPPPLQLIPPGVKRQLDGK